MYDLIIVGSGPAGMAAAIAANRKGLSYLVLERGVIADTIYKYPIGKPLFSTPNEVELEPGALRSDRKPTREEVLIHYAQYVRREKINIHTGEEVKSIAASGSGFIIDTSAGSYETRAVLLTVGGFGCRRQLGVPGEGPERVSYRFVEGHPFAMRPVLVVGGGNSAAEASLYLCEAGADVILSLRRGSLDLEEMSGAPKEGPKPSGGKIKPWVLEPLERAEREGRIKVIRSSRVVEIRPETVLLELQRGDVKELIEIECDRVFTLIGADPDTRLLRGAGAEIAEDGRPVYNAETYETTVPGLYVAGHITRELHMKNAIPVGQHVVEQIASHLLEYDMG